MFDHDDPVRLKRRRDLSPRLTRALLELQAGPDESARMTRVAAGLGPLLDLPLEATSRVVPRSQLQIAHRNGVLPWLAGGLLLLVPAAWLEHRGSEAPTLSSPAAAHGGEAAPPPIPAAPAVRQPALEVVSPATAERAPRHSAREAQRRVATRSTRLARATVEQASVPAAPAMAVESAGGSAEPAAERIAPAQPAAAVTRAEPAPDSMTARAQRGESTAAASESQLLIEARAALSADPQRALRLVAEHAARFPRGSLVPEREVLAIEALRKLGRESEASARLARFARRYPDSFYIERLRR